MPDIYPRFTKLYNSKIRHNSFNNELEPYQKGIFFHIKTDKYFHENKIFKQLEKDSKMFLEDKADIRRSKTVGHVLIELLLDYYILKSNPQLSEKFYTSLNKVNTDTLRLFFENIESENSYSKFLIIFERFRVNKYAESLTHIGGVLKATYYIFKNRLRDEFDVKDIIKLESDTKQFYSEIKYQLDILLRETKNSVTID